MQTVDDRWQRHNEKLDSIPTDGINFLNDRYFRKFIIMPLEKNTEMTVDEIKVLKEHHEVGNKSILEVGAAFGNFCKILHSEKPCPNNYTILDTASMLRFSKSFLLHHKIPCNFVESTNLSTLYDNKFDLFISNICLSETPDDYRQAIIDNIWPNCNGLFVIDGCLTTKEGNYNEWLAEQVKKHFQETVIEDIPQSICRQKHQTLYIGRK